MYNFRITDEPFATGYLCADSDSRHVRTGCGYREAAKSMNLVINDDLGFAWTEWGDMACISACYGGQMVIDARLIEIAENHPAHQRIYSEYQI